VPVAGHSPVAKDARVGPSELMDSRAREDSSTPEAPEEGVDALHGPMDREAEIPEEHPFNLSTL